MALKCLIVEDAPFMREIYRHLFRDSADIHIVAEADDGEKALKLISELQPELILLDLVLPLKSGLDVLQEVFSISPNSKVLVITSIDDQAILDKARALGAIQCLQKPFTKAQILDAITEVSKTYAEVQNG